jgi:hypothetical protein
LQIKYAEEPEEAEVPTAAFTQGPLPTPLGTPSAESLLSISRPETADSPGTSS